MTPDIAIQILQAVMDGETPLSLTERFDVPYDAIRKLCRSAGIELPRRDKGQRRSVYKPRRPMYGPPRRKGGKPNPHLQEILQKIQSGITAADIAADVGLSRERIRQIVDKHDLTLALFTTKRVLDLRAKRETAKKAKADKIQARKDYHRMVATKIKELRDAKYSWDRIAKIMEMSPMGALIACLKHYPEMRKVAFKPRKKEIITDQPRPGARP